MIPGQVPIPDHEKDRVWQTWCNTPAHRVLHNEFIAAMVAARTELETATCNNLPEIQGRLRALQASLAIINKKGAPI